MSQQLAQMLMNARFYGAKSEPITLVTTVWEAPAGPYRWAVLSVTHGTSQDLYQVLLDAEGQDVLGTPEGAAAYVAALQERARVHGDMAVSGEARPLDGEQSNTSLFFDGRMLKVFRRLEDGLNPDVELLSELTECPNVAPVRGHATGYIDGRDITLAMVQDAVPAASDGFQHALTLAPTPERPAGDVEAARREARLLGEATATVHRALAAAFFTKQVTAADVADALRAHFAELASGAAQLADFKEPILAVYDRLAAAGDAPLTVQRIHGDLHLGQVLRTEQGYTLIDFEGEPARPLEQRKRPDVVARDVAGLVRSWDYAAHFAAGGSPTPESEAWAQAVTEALLEGYGFPAAQSDGTDAELQELLLRAMIVDKACYELVYEANNRPDWVAIPFSAIERLTADAS